MLEPTKIACLVEASSSNCNLYEKRKRTHKNVIKLKFNVCSVLIFVISRMILEYFIGHSLVAYIQ